MRFVPRECDTRELNPASRTSEAHVCVRHVPRVMSRPFAVQGPGASRCHDSSFEMSSRGTDDVVRGLFSPLSPRTYAA